MSYYSKSMHIPQLSQKDDKVTYLVRERKRETPSLMVAINIQKQNIYLYRVVEMERTEKKFSLIYYSLRNGLFLFCTSVLVREGKVETQD